MIFSTGRPRARSFRAPFLLGLLVFFIGASDLQADAKVKNQFGEEQLFYADVIGDGSVIINFVYTRCEGVCPGQGQRFKQLQKLLGPRLGSDVRLVSLSIDPERDSPSDLKRWGEAHDAQKGWTLVTADRATTDTICKEILGMTLTPAEHSPFVAVRKGKGPWETLYGLSSPRAILSKLDK